MLVVGQSFVPSKMDQPVLGYQRHLSAMVMKIQNMSAVCTMMDTEFQVGLGEQDREIVKANATLLSLWSPYFREICFGEVLVQTSPKIVCIEVEIFRKVINYVHGTKKCLAIDSLTQAWRLRHAAEIFKMDELLILCTAYVMDHLDFKTALNTFKVARFYKAHDLRKAACDKMKNRYNYILSCDDLKCFSVNDMIDLVTFFKDIVKPSLVLKGLLFWSDSIGGLEKFRPLFQTKFYNLISWKALENDEMTKFIKMRLMLQTQEHSAMAAILSRSVPPSQPLVKEEVSARIRLVCAKGHMFLNTCSCRNYDLRLRQILLRLVGKSTVLTPKAEVGGGQKNAGGGSDGIAVDLYHNLDSGYRVFKHGITSGLFPPYCSTIPSEDIELEIRNVRSKTDLGIKNVLATAVDISGTLFILLNFVSDPIGVPDPNELQFRLRFSPFMLMDLFEQQLPKRTHLSYSNRDSPSLNRDQIHSEGSMTNVQLISWETSLQVGFLIACMYEKNCQSDCVY